MKSTFICLLLFATIVTSQAQQTTKPTDAAQIKTNMLNFYKWYTTNWSKLAAFKLYKSKKGKEGPPYVINWPEVETYFVYLRKNVPFLGEAFIASERMTFKKIEAAFKKHPKEEMPAGFDFDRFTDTQEDPKWFWDQLNKKNNAWTINVAGNTASVVIKGKGDKDTEPLDVFCGKMIKEKGAWKAATLACDAAVLEENQIP